MSEQHAEALRDHFRAVGLEPDSDQQHFELLIDGHWIDAHDQFRSVTVEHYVGGDTVKVEHQVDAGVLGMAWMESQWFGRWRIRRGFETVAEGEAR